MNRKMNYDVNASQKEMTPGGVITDAGNSNDFKTGDWRSMRPIWKAENCKHCLLCWVVCPDNSIMTQDGKLVGIDYDHCKGCGVCTKQCKFNALDFVVEE